MTVIFQESAPIPKERPISLFPLLVFLFIISYAMLTYLVVQQNATIASQRTLIHQLLGDSIELSSMKGKALQPKVAEENTAVSPKVPSATVPAKPKSDASPKARPNTKSEMQSGLKKHAMPERPSKNSNVVLDTRRVTFTL
ncbi:MAG TPA: hypothetical protein VHR84_16800 [Terriglobales bacterium]|nr:hypothetical protein [Terriglobales bacterium]